MMNVTFMNRNNKTVEDFDSDQDPCLSDRRTNSPEKRERDSENKYLSGKRHKVNKRKSCSSCHRLKTRCDFEDKVGKCHRCSKLQLDCSLSNDMYQTQSEHIGPKDTTSSSEMNELKGEILKLQSFVLELSNKLDNFSKSSQNRKIVNTTGVNLSRRENDLHSTYSQLMYISDNETDRYVSKAPITEIRNIRSKFYHSANHFNPLATTCDDFLKFYFQNESLFLKVAKLFLTKSQFWILPGDLKEIDRNYVLEHPFLAAVFILLGMGFDEISEYAGLQEEVYSLTTRLLGISLIAYPLTDHDIEALLYLSLHDLPSTPNQPEIDSWLLSGIAIKHFMLSVNFSGITKRVLQFNAFVGEDLYHLRIWNALCACHLQRSMLSCRPTMIPKGYLDINTLLLKFPKATIGDMIKVSEIELTATYLNISGMLSDYFKTLEPAESESFFIFKELEEWKSKWEDIIEKDLSGVLSFTYDTCYLLLSKRLISCMEDNSKEAQKESMDIKYQNTRSSHSSLILNRFLKLPPSLIRATPTTISRQVIYAALIMNELIENMTQEEKSKTANLITTIYWHLRQIGEFKNHFIDTFGNIIRIIAECANMSISSPPSAETNDNIYVDFGEDEIVDNYYNDSLEGYIKSRFFSKNQNIVSGNIENMETRLNISLDQSNELIDQSFFSSGINIQSSLLPSGPSFETFEDYLSGLLGKYGSEFC